ncbi:MAG: hypothetical protein HY900_02720 [Deltaproteobacteria bacterium]|nr:hypothetical protein [Deltaproteobacteria bacterium]
MNLDKWNFLHNPDREIMDELSAEYTDKIAKLFDEMDVATQDRAPTLWKVLRHAKGQGARARRGPSWGGGWAESLQTGTDPEEDHFRIRWRNHG